MSDTPIYILLVAIIGFLIFLAYRLMAIEEDFIKKLNKKLKGLTVKQQKAKKELDEALIKDMPVLLTQNPELLKEFPATTEVLKGNTTAASLFGSNIVESLIRMAMQGGATGELMGPQNLIAQVAPTIAGKLVDKLLNRKPKPAHIIEAKENKQKGNQYIKSDW